MMPTTVSLKINYDIGDTCTALYSGIGILVIALNTRYVYSKINNTRK